MASLLDMTDVPMKNILENCGFKSVLTLRKVCHSLRNFVDASCFKTDLKDIELTLGPNGFSVICRSADFSSTNGLGLAKDWTPNDLKIILKMAQNTKLTLFYVKTIQDNVGGLDDLEDILKNQTHPLQTKRFRMEGSEILKVLPYLDSKTLKGILIFRAYYENGDQSAKGIEKVIELEQFKNAVVLHIADCFLVRADLRKFFHFQWIRVKLLETSLEELVALKEAFVTSTHMQFFYLGGINLNENQLEQVFGAPFNDDGYRRSEWFFKNHNCKEHVLRIEWFSSRITFWKWEANKVPQDAVVQH
ncbi:unnamed protein product [Caenorhabditis brenneri]